MVVQWHDSKWVLSPRGMPLRTVLYVAERLCLKPPPLFCTQVRPNNCYTNTWHSTGEPTPQGKTQRSIYTLRTKDTPLRTVMFTSFIHNHPWIYRHKISSKTFSQLLKVQLPTPTQKGYHCLTIFFLFLLFIQSFFTHKGNNSSSFSLLTCAIGVSGECSINLAIT